MKAKTGVQAAAVKGSQTERIAASPEFHLLLKAKARFIIPGCVFFLVYYFCLPLLVGYAPELMQTRVGFVNLAYVFALSQFAMVGVVAWLYMRAARRFDWAAAAILAEKKGGR